MTVPTPPPESQGLTETVIRERLARSLKDVFRIMLRRPIELCDNLTQGDSVFITPPVGAGEALPTHIMGSVAFTGKVNGTLNLYFQEDFAAVCTRLLLRANEDYTKRTADTAVKDAMGEITNMSAGVFKNSLAAIGFPSRLVLPKVFRCRLGSMEPGYTASRYVYHFMSAETRVVVELLIKAGP